MGAVFSSRAINYTTLVLDEGRFAQLYGANHPNEAETNPKYRLLQTELLLYPERARGKYLTKKGSNESVKWNNLLTLFGMNVNLFED